jgi:hypothetical protein
VRNLERAGVPRAAAMKIVGHKTESIYRRYSIVDHAMLALGAETLDRPQKLEHQGPLLHRSLSGERKQATVHVNVYSAFSATTGSTRAARRAGSQLARTAATDTTVPTAAMVAGSWGLVWKRKLEISRVA